MGRFVLPQARHGTAFSQRCFEDLLRKENWLSFGWIALMYKCPRVVFESHLPNMASERSEGPGRFRIFLCP